MFELFFPKEILCLSFNLTFLENWNLTKKIEEMLVGGVCHFKFLWVVPSFLGGVGVVKICKYLLVISNCAFNKLCKKSGKGR